jgi:hypothetical protein
VREPQPVVVEVGEQQVAQLVGAQRVEGDERDQRGGDWAGGVQGGPQQCRILRDRP